MSLATKIRSWWKALAHRSALESEIETELGLHIENYAADLMQSGMPAADAVRKARMELGTVAVQKEKWRQSLGLQTWDDLTGDIRYAFRQLRRAPVFTITVLTVLALGIGANAAMFSLIDTTLLRQLPFSRPNELVVVDVYSDKGTSAWAFYADLREWQAQSKTLAVAYYNPSQAFLETPGMRQTLSAPAVSANMFQVLGRRPSMGRDFLPDDQVPGRSNVVILSDAVWRNLMGGDPDVIGKQVKIDAIPSTVIGVMPPQFSFPSDERQAEIWKPQEIKPGNEKRDFSGATFNVIARLQKGATLNASRAELSGIQRRLATLYSAAIPDNMIPKSVDMVSYHSTLVKSARAGLLALAGAVAIIWLIACANVANLMLARSAARQREIAVRNALGAGQWRILRQVLTESLVLSMTGAACGLALAQIVLHVFERTLSRRLNLPLDFSPDLRVLLALMGLSILSAMLFGFFPAILSARFPLEQALRRETVQAGGRGHNRFQQLMVVAEIGLSLVLLVACGLLLRTVFQLRKVPLGFRTDHVMLLQPSLPQYRSHNVDVTQTIYQPLLERIRHMNGVDAADMTTTVPLRHSFDSTINFILDKSKSELEAKLMASGTELQKVLGFSMYQGRYFNEQDTRDSQPVVVINRAFAQMYAPEGDVLEKLKLRLGKDRTAKVVGIMDDFHQVGIDKPSMPEIDFCANQLIPTDLFYQPTMQAHVELALRISRDPKIFMADLRRVLSEADQDLETSSIVTMDQVVDDSMGNQLLAAHLLELLAGAALLVALSGLYGLLSYLVSQRTRELGVRMALGAQRKDIMEMLLGQAGKMLLIGSAAGILLALASTRLLAGFLFGVKPHDLATMLVVTTLLLAVGFIAAYLPARTASRVNPIEALRRE